MKQSLLFISIALAIASCTATRQQGNGHPGAEATGNSSPLQHKRWILAGFPGQAFEQPEKDVYILFERDKPQAVGFAGCNGFRGSYETEDRALHIKNVISTKMWCNYGPLEQQFIQVLEATDGYRIWGDSMQFLRGEEVLASLYGVVVQ